MLQRLLLALSFLSRLAPARTATEKDLAASVAYYPAAGAILGLVVVAPFFFGLASGSPWVQAWLYVVLNAWLTRALHWDGWADLFDALGSAARGEKFQTILKDSRLGAFGAIGLTLGLGGQVILAAAHFQSGDLLTLLWAPILGRCAVSPLALLAPAAPWSGLGRLACAGANKSALAASGLFAIGGGLMCVNPGDLLPGLLICLAGIYGLARAARREGGLNGDFFGAAIIWGELSALLAPFLL